MPLASERTRAPADSPSFQTLAGEPQALEVPFDEPGINDAPVVTVPESIALQQNNYASLAGISFADVDAGAVPVTVTFSVPVGTLSAFPVADVAINQVGLVLSLTGSIAKINAMLAAGQITYTPMAGDVGTYVLTVSIDDGGNTGAGGAKSDSQTLDLVISEVNNAPWVTVPAAPISTAEDTAVSLAGLAFNDSDAGDGSVTVTLTVGAGQLLASPGAGVTIGGTAAARTLDGSIADINAFIAAGNLQYQPAPDATGTVTVTASINDNGHSGAGSALTSMTGFDVSVTPVNDAPAVSAPGSIAVTEDTPQLLTGISFSDPDAGNGIATATFSVPAGALSATASGGVAVGGTAAALTLSGTLANINAFLAGGNLAYTPAADDHGTRALTVELDDNGNTGTGGARSDTQTVALQIAPENDAPVLSVPASLTATEDEPFTFTGISLADVDAGIAPVTVTLSVPVGSLAASSGSGVTVGGTAGALTLTGTVGDLNAFLAAHQVAYTAPSNHTQDVVVTVAANDGSASDEATFTLHITAVNDAPVNTVPGAQSVTTGGRLVFSTANGNAIAVADADAGDGEITVSLVALGGVLTLAAHEGVTVEGGDTAGVGALVLHGSQADINAALQGLAFEPDEGYVGGATITLQTEDNGLSGGAGQQDTDAIGIQVLPQPPRVTSVAAITPDGAYGAGEPIRVVVNFDQEIELTVGEVGPTLKLSASEGGGLAQLTAYSPTQLVFTYHVQEGDDTADLDIAGTDALSLQDFLVRLPGTDVDALLTLPAPGSTGSLAANAAIVLDTAAPTLSAGNPADGAARVEVDASLRLTFSEEIRFGRGQVVLWDLTNGREVEVFQVGGRTRAALAAAAEPPVGANDGELAIAGNVLVVNPTELLAAGTAYALHITEGTLRDRAGNAFAGFEDDTTYNFTTRSAGAPQPQPQPPKPAVVTGTADDDVLAGTAADERFEALAGRDTVTPGGGKDWVDGGEGIDTVVFAGDRAAWIVERTGQGAFIVSNAAGDRAELHGIERLQFDDVKLAMDLTAQQAQIARLYAAALDRAPDEAGLAFYVDAVEDGWSLARLANAFVHSPEYQQEYGGTSDTGFLTLLYQNAFGRAPDAAGLAFQLDVLAHDTGLEGRAHMLAAFIASPETQVQLAGQAEQGVALYAA